MKNSRLENKVCHFSIDFEEWFHIPFMKPYDNIEYREKLKYCDKLKPYIESLLTQGVQITMFVVADIVETYKKELIEFHEMGVSIGCHSRHHLNYKTMTVDEFVADVKEAKDKIEKTLGFEIHSFRAPMFSASYEQLSKLPSIGITMDSSSINSSKNPFYKKIPSSTWENDKSGLKEYEIPVQNGVLLGGGGYFRSTALWVYKLKLKDYLKTHDSFVFFLHPYEICLDDFPYFPKGIFSYGYFRYNYGRKIAFKKFKKLLKWLIAQGVKFEKME